MKSFRDKPISRDPEFARGMLQGLVVECPVSKHPQDCPCAKIREMHPDLRIRWVNELSDVECVDLYQSHLACLERKCQEAIKPPKP